MFVIFLLLALALARPVHAYADPGTGTMLYQVVMAAIIGGVFQFRKLASFFRRRRNPKK
ncbi:MAG: hypothetical protein LAO18_24205 [Acidobacteriia bacterium]|nr:hypothetical protein [Terriglobia bacterium]